MPKSSPVSVLENSLDAGEHMHDIDHRGQNIPDRCALQGNSPYGLFANQGIA